MSKNFHGFLLSQLLLLLKNYAAVFFRKKSPDYYTYIFKSLCLVVRAQKHSLTEDVRKLLPQLLATGLTRGLTEVFEQIVAHIPSLKTDVLDGLMGELYTLLLNRTLPDKLAPPTPPPLPDGLIHVSAANVALIKLALQTLGGFDFQRHALQMFMQFIAKVCGRRGVIAVCKLPR